MKKLMIAFAAIAAFVSVASATDWFTGTIGSEAGGSWTMTPGDGSISTNTTTLVLEDARASFEADSQKPLSGSANLNFATKVNFKYSYDDLPSVEDGAKAGLVVCNNKYYVLAKGDSGNEWFDTSIDATSVDSDVDVRVTISNGTDSVYAVYVIGESTVVKSVASEGAWGSVSYNGSGVVASLVGTTTPLEAGYPIPGGKVIPKSIGDAWASAQGIPAAEIGAVLANTQLYAGSRTAAESCLLGVATNVEIRAVAEDKTADKLDFTVQCTPVAGRVSFQLKKDGVSVGVADALQIDIADGVYTVVAYVDGANKEIPVSQAIGVKGTEVASSKVYFIGAPWADCSIADLFKKTCCAVGDKVEVYDAATDSYKSWQFTGTAWEFADGQGVEPESIKKGQAVKYTTAAGTTEEAKLWQVGNVSEENTTPIVKGKWNLVASPKGSIAATALPLDSAAAQAIQLSASGTAVAKTYLKYGDDVKYRDGYKGRWENASDEDEVTNAFFVKPTNAESINW